MKISILLPYKENFSPKYAGAVSLFVSQTVESSKFKKDITQSRFTLTKLKTIYFFPSNRWDILTYDNILIKLPQDNISKSLNLAYKIINSNDFQNKNLIDLRINNRLTIE